jgi:hypothetical protein
MEDNEPLFAHTQLERVAEAQFNRLGQNGTLPVRRKILYTGNSSKSK